MKKTQVTAILGIGIAIALTGCRGAGITAREGEKVAVRLAYFPNVTHAAALVGAARGTFASSLGKEAVLKEQIFNAGPAEIEALFADQVDLGYIGPGPAINGFLKSKGRALRIIAGASSGGASLVVSAESGITEIKGLAGKRVADPQLGGTQDLSLRHAVQLAGLSPTEKGGTVSILPMANPDTLTLFVKRQLDAAWVPEPWVSRLVKEAKGRILVDERDQWPNRQFATTIVIVRTRFLNDNPELVHRFLKAHVETVDWIKANPKESSRLVGEQIKRHTGKAIPADVLTDALSRTEFTYDPLRESVLTFADWSRSLGYLREDRSALKDLFDLRLLNDTMARRGSSK